MLSKILVAIDGSDNARRALDFAGELATRFDSELLVISVAPCTDLPAPLKRYASLEHPDARPEQVHQAIAQNMLGNARQQLTAKVLAKTKTQVSVGDPAQEILEAAAAHDADAIVLGTRGLSTLKGLLVGSVSHKVNHLAPCTCITVR